LKRLVVLSIYVCRRNDIMAYAMETQREGPIARAIEKQTSRIPSDLFLWAGLASIAGSLLMKATGKKSGGNFVANWVPTILLLGLYNKIVKIAGHDRQERQTD
jgi:hypothetical protein